MPSIWLAGVALAAAMMATGCVFPVWWGPGFGASRHNLSPEGPTFIVASRTTRQEVLLTLGEPDGEAPDESWFAYGSAWTEGGAGVAVIVIAPAPGAGMAGGFFGTEKVVFRRLLVHFDAQGTVNASHFETRTCRESSGGVFVMTGGTGQGGVTETAPCIDITGIEFRRQQQLDAVAFAGPQETPAQDAVWVRGPVTTVRGLVRGRVLVTQSALVFLPPPGVYGQLPRPLVIAFSDVAEVTSRDFGTITRVTRRDGARFTFRLPSAVRDLVTQRAQAAQR